MEVFMDNLIGYKNSFENCLKFLEKALSNKKINLVLNEEKCQLMVSFVIVLTDVIFEEKNEVDKTKVDVIDNLPSPKMIKEVRSFLGYGGFIEYYNGF